MAMKVRDKEVFNDKGLIRILVYGTLKKGHGNHRILSESGAEFVGYDSVTGPFKMCDMVGFPGIYRPDPLENNTTIYGELWAMEPEGLASCDLLEGHPSFYRREKWWTNNEKRAWMYALSPQFLEQMKSFTADKAAIPEGIWRPSDDETKFWEGFVAPTETLNDK